ncbi:DUF6207 family protein [Streptomyces sp. NPDC093149]|uniref:DUF6207 family protein n=1 Tax=Streptomyces sp. NPDC093149 TaxID=3366031 RepID=UPI0037FBAF7E
MEQIDPLHVSEPGLLVVDLTAADEETVQAAIDVLGRRWAASGGGRTSGGTRATPVPVSA